MNINQKIDAQPRRDLARITVSLLNDLVAAPLDQADAAAERALRVLGDAGGFDRTYVFEIRDGVFLDNSHEWVADDVEPMIDRLQGLSIGLLGPWFDEFMRDQCVEVPYLSDLAQDHPARQILVEQGICSLLLVPMLQDGQLLGFLGYDAVRAPRRLNRDEVFLLRCASNGVAALLARRRAAEARDRAMTELRAALAEQARTEARFHDVAAISRSWVWEQDADLRFTYVSESFRLVSGVETAQVIGRTRDELIADRPDCQVSTDWAALAARIAARKPFSGFVYRATAAPERGRDIWIQISGRPVFDGAGRFRGYRGAGTDVTELHRALERAEAGSRAKTAFLTTMSHEIRTPLNGILGATELMQDMIETPKAMEWLGAIRDSGETLMAMLDDLLDVSSLEAGVLTLEDGVLDPAELVARLEPVYTLRAQDRGLDFVVRVTPAATGRRRGDGTRVLQILHHLLGNALKFTPRGAITLELAPSAPDRLRVTVADTGIGMSAEQLDRVWLPFEQALGGLDRPHPGRGLGLTIVRSLVSMMGGELSVDSAPGRGTRIAMDLPLPRLDEARTQAAPADLRREPPAPRRNWAELTVLVADDNSINRLILKSMLEAVGIQADMAGDGREALGLWKIRHHDLVLMDIAMPGMDGITALSAIRQSAEQGGHPRPVAVAVTANALRPQLDEYLAAGFDRCLGKPVRRSELEAAIAAFWPQTG